MPTATITCPHCGTARAFCDVLMLEKDKHDPGHACGFARCRSCDCFLLLYFYRRSGGPEIETAMKQEVDLEQIHYTVKQVVPHKSEDIPLYLPEEILNAYEEAFKAYLTRSWGLAAIGFERVLELATRDLLPDMSDKPLAERLRASLAGGHVTSPLREWLQEAQWPAHGEDKAGGYNRADAIHLRFFCESFLKYIYELPGLIADRRRRATGKIDEPE